MTPPAPHDRLGEEGGDGVRAFLDDQLLQVPGAARREILFRLALFGLAVKMRTIRVQEALDGQVEIVVNGRQPRQAAGGDGNSVIGPVAGDDLLFLRSPEGVVVVPDQLDRQIVGFRARIGEQHLRHRHRGDGDQLRRQLDGYVGGLVGKAVVVGEPFQGLGGGFDQAFLGKAQRRTPQPGQAFDIGLAAVVLDADAVAAGNDQRALILVFLEIGVAVHMIGNVAAGGGISSVGHVTILLNKARPFGPC